MAFQERRSRDPAVRDVHLLEHSYLAGLSADCPSFGVLVQDGLTVQLSALSSGDVLDCASFLSSRPEALGMLTRATCEGGAPALVSRRPEAAGDGSAI